MKFSGAKLRALRNAAGLTQAELAHRAHVRERQIIRWENDQNVPRTPAVAVLASVFGEPLTSFFTEGADETEDDEESDPVAVLVAAIRDLVRAEIRKAA